MTTPTFTSLNDLSAIDWDGESDFCTCVLKTRITRNPKLRNIRMSFADMEVFYPYFGQIMRHKPYDLKYAGADVVLFLARVKKDLPKNGERVLMLHEPKRYSRWESTTLKHDDIRDGKPAVVIGGYGELYVSHRVMDANFPGIVPLIERADALQLGPERTTVLLKHCINQSVHSTYAELLDNQMLWDRATASWVLNTPPVHFTRRLTDATTSRYPGLTTLFEYVGRYALSTQDKRSLLQYCLTQPINSSYEELIHDMPLWKRVDLAKSLDVTGDAFRDILNCPKALPGELPALPEL